MALFTWTTDHIFPRFCVATSGWRSIFQKFLFSTFAYCNTLALRWTFVWIPIQFTWGTCIIFTTITFFLLPTRLIEVFCNRTTDLRINFYIYFLNMISLPITNFDLNNRIKDFWFIYRTCAIITHGFRATIPTKTSKTVV